MLVHRGTLRVGDAIVAGDAHGKVRGSYDYRGERVTEARPGTPIEILGFNAPPPAGEFARVVEDEREARTLAQRRGQRLRTESFAQRSKGGVSLESLFSALQEGAVQDLNMILKGDVGGSVEAAVSELAKIQHPEVRVNVIHQGVGAITEGDIMLAATSNALVVGFNVRPNTEARQLAEREGVDIRTYRVIYQLTEDIEQALVGMLSAVQTEEITRRGRGARALQGLAARHDRRLHGHHRRRPRNSQVRVVRDGTVIYDTTIAQLKRFKETPARSPRASSAASCSTTSTTSRKATSSRPTRRAKSSGHRSTSLPALPPPLPRTEPWPPAARPSDDAVASPCLARRAPGRPSARASPVSGVVRERGNPEARRDRAVDTGTAIVANSAREASPRAR
jgi:translation initiation factor IF-2